MKKSIISGSLAVLGLLTLAGCNDFLDDNRYPKTEIVNTPEYWSNSSNVQLQVDRFIDEFSQGYGTGSGGGWFYFKVLSDDQVGSGFEDWAYPTAVPNVSDWSYTNVRGANYIISGVQTASLDQLDRLNFLGIARLIRAYSYYQLVRKFGDVVWESSVVDPGDKEILYGPRTKRDIVMDSVFADLDYAIANIQQESSKTTWSKDYARAIKSEVALYEGTFCRYRTAADNGEAPNEDRAKKYLKESADVSKVLLDKYGFCDDYHSIYNSLWTADPAKGITGLSDNPELIFGRRYDATNGRHSTISYTASSTTTSGMSLDAFNAFLFKDGKPLATTSENKTLVGVPTAEDTTANIKASLSIQNLLDVREKRLSIITDPYVYYKGMEWSREGCAGMNSSSGFGIAKYDNIKLPVGDRTNSANNYTSCPIYWKSYIALNYAEAMAELGAFDQAAFDASIKHLYVRAGLDMITGPAYLESINDPERGNVSSLLFEIRRCRRCELMFDNWIRYWDLVRWHELDRLDSQTHPNILRGAYVANAPVAPADVDAEGYIRPYPKANRKYDKKYYLYPIPTGQLELNPDLGKNPGW